MRSASWHLVQQVTFFAAGAPRVFHPAHRFADLTFGLTALQDQELAGSLIWFWVTIAYPLPASVITLRMLSPGAGRALQATVWPGR